MHFYSFIVFSVKFYGQVEVHAYVQSAIGYVKYLDGILIMKCLKSFLTSRKSITKEYTNKSTKMNSLLIF